MLAQVPGIGSDVLIVFQMFVPGIADVVPLKSFVETHRVLAVSCTTQPENPSAVKVQTYRGGKMFSVKILPGDLHTII